MTDVPTHLKFTREHEWLELDGDCATVGITDYAQQALGDLVFVELPEVGAALQAGDSVAVVESVKAASEVYSPLSGTIVEVNEALADSPEAINDVPYGDGWIFKIKLGDTQEREDCMTAADYENYVAGLE